MITGGQRRSFWLDHAIHRLDFCKNTITRSIERAPTLIIPNIPECWSILKKSDDSEERRKVDECRYIVERGLTRVSSFQEVGHLFLLWQCTKDPFQFLDQFRSPWHTHKFLQCQQAHTHQTAHTRKWRNYTSIHCKGKKYQTKAVFKNWKHVCESMQVCMQTISHHSGVSQSSVLDSKAKHVYNTCCHYSYS